MRFGRAPVIKPGPCRRSGMISRMAPLQGMPPLVIDSADLSPFGEMWRSRGGSLSRSRPYSSLQLGELVDSRVGAALSVLLGNVPVVKPKSTQLTPSHADCVEVGPVRLVGGVRPQNFDVGYRPDGLRFAFDSKTLNDRNSVQKNYQNMINDLATEATTVHSRFPYAVVGFLVAVPEPCLMEPQASALVGTLERLSGRILVDQPAHLAEVISMVVWNPEDGTISSKLPAADSRLRFERFSEIVEAVYRDRYKGLPPHTGEGVSEPTE
jgi:hypothetical protein